MPDIVKIVGNEVQYVREEVVKKVGIDSFIANIENNLGVNTGILPRGCLYMKREGSKCLYLVEVPAGLVPVSFKDNNGTVTNYMISIPFTQFYVLCNPTANTILSIYMSVTKTPLMSVEQEIFVAPYLNIFGHGKDNVCTGSMQIPQDVPLKIKVDSTVSTFFEADFNADLTPSAISTLGEYRNPKDYIMKWAKATAKDRFFSCSPSTEYRKHDKNPAQIIEQVMQ
jgi:hypothetical protein